MDCLSGWGIWTRNSVISLSDGIMNCKDDRIWLSQHWEDDDFETWKGIQRCFGISRQEISVLRRAKIVTDTFFDDGTLHISINMEIASDIVRNTMADEDVMEIIEQQNNIIEDANRIVESLNN